MCINTCCKTATPLAYYCDCDRVVHDLSPFSLAFYLSTTQHYSYAITVRVAQVWSLNLIIELEIFSIIYVQKIVNIKFTT